MLTLYLCLLLSCVGSMCNASFDIDPSLKDLIAWNEAIISKMLLEGHKAAGEFGADRKVRNWVHYKKECEKLHSQGKYEDLEQRIKEAKSVYDCVQETSQKIQKEKSQEKTQADTKQHTSCIIS